MKKTTTLKFALGMTIAGLVMAGSSALAFGPPPAMQDVQNETMGSMMDQISKSVTATVPMDALSVPADQLSAAMPQLDLRQMIEQAVASLPDQQRDQLATEMANQNLSLLEQGSSQATQIRDKIRDSIMTERYTNISTTAPGKFRSTIQPMAVQAMISQIRPWEFPAKFKNKMMPVVVANVSSRIKQPQIEYMQDGIINNSAFPNVPGMPAGMVEAVSGQIRDRQLESMRNGVMNDPSFPGIVPQQ